MNTNPYDYNRPVPWIEPQPQAYYAGWPASTPGSERYHPAPEAQKLEPPRRSPQKAAPKPPVQPRMPKAQTLALARTLKRWLVVTSILGFGAFSGLAAFHQVGSTSTTSSSSTTTKSGQTTTPASSSSSQVAPTPTTSSGGFFNQQGGSSIGTGNSSQPASGTHTS